MDPWFTHLPQRLMLNGLQPVRSAAPVELPVFPDIVAKQFRGVVANAACRVLAKDSMNGDGVLRVDPESELRIFAGAYRRSRL